MHFYEALEKTQPKKAPESADPAPAGVTQQDLKDVIKAFQDALSSNNESVKKEIMEMIKNSNASEDVTDKPNNEESEENKNEC